MNSSIAEIARSFASVAPACDEWSIRLVQRRHEFLSVTRGTADPIRRDTDLGVMINVSQTSGGLTGAGYAATSDLSATGLKRAAEEALRWAKLSAGRLVAVPIPRRTGRQYDRVSTPAIPWHSV